MPALPIDDEPMATSTNDLGFGKDQRAQRGEGIGARYDLELLKSARERTIRATREIAAAIGPGMVEADAHAVAAQVFAALEIERVWHPSHIRFGANTLKTFREASDPAVVLGADDVFFIDLGPVYAGHEGDYGDTFVVGDAPALRAMATAARTLFNDTARAWREQRLSGRALYAFATERANALGYRLNLGAPGHRVGDFPHSIHQGGKLADKDHVVDSGLWVLEIQIAHSSAPVGAFYEDILFSD